ncbi:MAG TPA: hypothetical protein PKL98_00070 [Candidatus Pacearchaeota archaeon]|nr:hypothetical protein [Candidatus Pacearchaeota archaeon]
MKKEKKLNNTLNNTICQVSPTCENCPQKKICNIIPENRRYVQHENPKD